MGTGAGNGAVVDCGIVLRSAVLSDKAAFFLQAAKLKERTTAKETASIRFIFASSSPECSKSNSNQTVLMSTSIRVYSQNALQ